MRNVLSFKFAGSCNVAGVPNVTPERMRIELSHINLGITIDFRDMISFFAQLKDCSLSLTHCLFAIV